MSATPTIDVQSLVDEAKACVERINAIAETLHTAKVSTSFSVVERSSIGSPNREALDIAFHQVITPTRFERRG